MSKKRRLKNAMKILPLPVSLLLLIATAACSPQNATEIAAQSTAESAFSPGPVIADYGPAALIDADFKIPTGTKFKVSYDTVKTTEPGEINKTLTTAARFLNMHAKAGVAEEDMELAIVFHSKAIFDLTTPARYGETFDGPKNKAENANAGIIKALLDKNTRIIVCGQSAAFYEIKNEDLLPGVEMALSAMTAHAVLQQEGYTLNPF